MRKLAKIVEQIWLHAKYLIVLGAIALCFKQLYVASRAEKFAKTNGCSLDEGSRHPCLVNGIDHGERLYLDFTSAWYMFITAPIALILVLVLFTMSARDVIASKMKR